MLPAAVLLAVLVAVFAVAPSMLASSGGTMRTRELPVAPAAAEPITATDPTEGAAAAARDQATPTDRGVELSSAVQYVCRGVPVDPRIETTVVDCDG